MKFDDYLNEMGTELTATRGEHLFRQGDRDSALYYIRRGILKAYYLTEDGREQVKSLVGEGTIMGSLTAAYKGGMNSFSLVALEDATLVRFEFGDMQALARRDPEVTERMTDLLFSLAMKKERREYEFLCLSAEERYRLLCERSPELIERVTQQDIALYLGITPVALSRIKKRINS